MNYIPDMTAPARNPQFESDDEYQKIMDIVQGLWEGHVITRGTGFCLSMSDLVHNLLKQQAGIDSIVTECKLTVFTNNPPTIKLIGHEGMVTYSNVNNLDTHVICITKTKTPFLIDLSVCNVIPYVKYIVEPLVSAVEPREIATFIIGDSKWIYQEREQLRLPQIQQSNMLQRWRTDNLIFSKIKLLNILIGIALFVSTLNAIRGGYDFYQVYFEPKNNWGPDTLQEIKEHLDSIDNKLQPEQLRKRIEDSGLIVERRPAR